MKVLMLVSDGFEEVEALTVVDMLRRGGVTVDIWSITGSRTLVGSHQIVVEADGVLPAKGEGGFCDLEQVYDALVLPGGLPNSHTLRDDERVRELARTFYRANKLVSAICAAPCVLEAAGLLEGRAATSYPGCLDENRCKYRQESVVCSGRIVTSRGVGTALPFAFALLEELGLPEEAKQLRKSVLYLGGDTCYREIVVEK